MSVTAAGAAMFNLICTGSVVSGPILDLHKKESPVSIILRVDLAKGRWCSGDCETTAKIIDITENTIVFRMSEDDKRDDVFFVNRESGSFFDRTRSFELNWMQLAQGSCEKAEFTGMPVRKF